MASDSKAQEITRAETSHRHANYTPHLKRITDPDPTNVLELYPHHMLPRPNQARYRDSSTASPHYAFELSQHTASAPLPVPVPGLVHLAGRSHVDPVHRLPRAKDTHLTRLQQMRNQHDWVMRERRTKLAMRGLHPDVHLNIVREIAEELPLDPDEHFPGGPSDWYCTGSTMCVVQGGCDGDGLVHVMLGVDGQLNRLVLSRLGMANGNVQLTANPLFDSITNSISEHGHIYEVQYCCGRVCVRQKHRITIIDISQHTIVDTLSSTGKNPFVSAALDTEASHLITVDVQRCVCVWLIGNGSAEASSTAASADDRKPTWSAASAYEYISLDVKDPWSTVRAYDEHVLAHTDRQTVRLYDTRMPCESDPVYQYSCRPVMERCESVACMELPAVGRILVASTHKLFALDVRTFSSPLDDSKAGDDTKRADLLQWTTQLQCAPAAMAWMKPPDAVELCALTAHKPGEVVMCEIQTTNESRLTSSACPYRPPAPWDSYQIARRLGECLDPRSAVHDQLRASVTGIQWWLSNTSSRSSPSVHLLQQNSAGHVFASTFAARADRSDCHAVAAADVTAAVERGRVREAFAKWEAQLKLVDDNKAVGGYAHDIVNLRAMANVVAKNVSNPFGIGGSGMVDTTAIAVDANRDDRAARWRQPMRKLRSYMDALAPSMLEVWNMPEDDNDKVAEDDAAVGSLASATGARLKKARISAWLERTSTQNDVADGEVAPPLPPALGMDVSMSTIAPTQGGAETEMTTMRAADVTLPVSQMVEPMQLDVTAMTLEDATQLAMDTMNATTSGRPAKKKARKVRAFVPGF